MTTLAEKLEAIVEASKKRIPPDKRELMHQATQELTNSGMADRALKAGDTLPSFSLRNANDEVVNSADLLAKGPVVISLFRGSW